MKTGYRILFIAFLFVGSLPTAEGISAVVAVGDIGNALMAVPNLIALVLLAKEVGKITMSGATGALTKDDLIDKIGS